MYSNQEEYLQATRDAQVNMIDRKERKGILLFINFLLFLALSVIGFLYFTQNSNYLSKNIFGKQTAVLGATHRSTDTDYSDEELMVMLDNSDDKTVDSSLANRQAKLAEEMNQVINNLTMKSKSKSDYSDEELMLMLDNPDGKPVSDSDVAAKQAELTNEMNQVINNITIKSKSNYESAISKELDDKNKNVKGRVVVVKKGDTFSSLAKQYDGDSMAFHPINGE